MSVRERAVRMRAVLPLCTYVLGYCFGSLLLVEHDLAAWNSTLRRTVLPRCPGTPCHTPGTIRHAPGAPCRTPGTPCHAPGAHASVNLDGFRCSRGMATRSGGVASRSEDGAGRSGPRRPVPGAWLRAAAPRTWAVCPALRGRARPIAGGCTAPCRSPGRL